MRDERREKQFRAAIVGLVAAVVFHLAPLACLAKPAVLLVPFTQLDDSTGAQWIGSAVARSLQSDLAGNCSRIDLPGASAGGLVLDDRTAITRLAHDAKADLVVSGHFQIIDEQIRLTGSVLDGKTGETIAALKATGDTKNLFSVEDDLAKQVREGMRANVATQATPTTAPSALPTIDSAGPLKLAVHRPAPVGTVEARYYNHAAELGRDRYLFGSAACAYRYPCGIYFGCGFFGCGYGSGACVVTGGGGSLAW